MTIAFDNAQLAATRNRLAAADLVLEVAVHEAQELVAVGRSGRAEFVMTRAGMAAERILGSAS